MFVNKDTPTIAARMRIRIYLFCNSTSDNRNMANTTIVISSKMGDNAARLVNTSVYGLIILLRKTIIPYINNTIAIGK